MYRHATSVVCLRKFMEDQSVHWDSALMQAVSAAMLSGLRVMMTHQTIISFHLLVVHVAQGAFLQAKHVMLTILAAVAHAAKEVSALILLMPI